MEVDKEAFYGSSMTLEQRFVIKKLTDSLRKSTNKDDDNIFCSISLPLFSAVLKSQVSSTS